VLAGVFVTAFYSFRMYFLVFHGKERWMEKHHDAHHADDHHGDEHHGLGPHDKPHESPWVVTLPLIALAIPSVIIGFIAIEPMLFGSYFNGVILIDAERHPAMHELAHHFHGAAAMGVHALTTAPFWLALSGVVLSWFFYMKRPDIPAAIKQRCGLLYRMMENKYGFDQFNDWFFAGGSRFVGGKLWQIGDVKIIDGLLVNGTARLIGYFSTVIRKLQSGLIYHYAFAMIIGAFLMLTFWFAKI
jgi:NADH-quinone oxidoreductase subunit L